MADGTTTSTAAPSGVREQPVTIELVRNGLAAIADEMAITEVRAAYSTVVRDLLDFSTAICDGQGRVLAQGLNLAIQLGAIPRFMLHVLARSEPVAPGDVYLANDPWQGGTHLPDFFFARPIFLAGEAEPVAWAAIVSHMVDVGGRFPGGISVVARSLWEEGLTLPIVPLAERGVVSRPLLDVIAANVREPGKVLGDIRAVLAGLETGERQVLELAARFGADALRGHMEAFLEYSERATRAALASLPDGSGHAVGFLDDDGCGGPPVRLECRVEKRGEELAFDFTGTADQVPGGINSTLGDVSSVTMLAAGAMLGEDLVVNDGFTRCISFTIPEGTVASARRPAAVSARGTLVYRLADVALAALATLIPDRVPAEGGGPGLVYFSGTRASGEPWICIDYVQAGWGATAAHDGVAGASHAIVNSGSLPAEPIEQEYPVRVVASELLADSAGAGLHVGAPAVAREYEVLVDAALSYRIERHAFPPQGSAGGGAGSPARCAVRRAGGDWEEAPSKAETTLRAGDRFRIELPSGAGVGDPAARPAADVARDVRDGVLSPERAAAQFGAA